MKKPIILGIIFILFLVAMIFLNDLKQSETAPTQKTEVPKYTADQ